MQITLVVPTSRHPIKWHPNLIEQLKSSVSIGINVVIVDDTFSQDFPKLEFASKTIRTGGRKGPLFSMLAASHHINGGFIAFQNDDDPLMIERLFAQHNKLVESKKSFCTAPVEKRTRQGMPIPYFFGNIRSNKFSEALLLLGAFGFDAALMARIDIIQEMLPVNANYSDWIMGLRHLTDANTTTIKDHPYRYIQHSEQITRNQKGTKFEHFRVVFPEWAARNAMLNLPPLTIEEAFVVTIGPFQRNVRLDYERLNFWFEALKEILEPSDRGNYPFRRSVTIEESIWRRRIWLDFRFRRFQSVWKLVLYPTYTLKWFIDSTLNIGVRGR
jgi:hypothetical protein